MENIATAQPWQIAFFLVACLVVAVVISVWLFTGNDPKVEPVSLHPVDVIGNAWSALLHWRPVDMSSNRARGVANDRVQNRAEMPVSSEKINPETAETSQLDAETRNELITLGETRAIARLVASETIGLTEGVKIGAGAKSGERYQKRTRQIKAEVEKLKAPEYPALEATKRPSVVENL